MEETKSSSLEVIDASRVDCALFDPYMGIVGQSWHVDVRVDGDMDAKGFVIDFSQLKKIIKKASDTTIDHTLIVPTKAEGVRIKRIGNTGQIIADLETEDGKKWSYEANSDAFTEVCSAMVAIKDLEGRIEREIIRLSHLDFKKVKVSLREQEASGEFFQYTHGLFDYDGHCSRIFHGHRGLVEVRQDGEKSEALSKTLSRSILRGRIHIACKRQIEDQRDGFIVLRAKKPHDIRAQLPIESCLVLDNETSIEHIAEYCLTMLSKTEKLVGEIEVKVCEGIHKSAISRSNFSN